MANETDVIGLIKTVSSSELSALGIKQTFFFPLGHVIPQLIKICWFNKVSSQL